jgi:hypothetical protein
VKAKITGLLKALVNAGFETGAKYSKEETIGVLQKDLATLTITRINCKKEVVELVLDKLQLQSPTKSSNTKNTPEMKIKAPHSVQSSPEKHSKQESGFDQKPMSGVNPINEITRHEITNQVPVKESKLAFVQSMSNSPGGVQVGGNVGAITLNQDRGENSARLRSELTRLLRYPAAVPDAAKGRTLIERQLANKLPARVFDIVMSYDEKTILGTPEIGPTLQEFLLKYYQFRQLTMNLEDQTLRRIGQIVTVPFRAAWGIYFKYAVMRFGGLSENDVVSGGNFLNYDITWEDSERVFAELSKEPSLSREFSNLFQLNRELIQEVRMLGATLEQAAVIQRNQ